jgi:predicted ATPase
MLTRLSIAGYGSVRNLPLELGPVTVFVGANGSGKSNFYRAMRLFAATAAGRLSRALDTPTAARDSCDAGHPPRRVPIDARRGSPSLLQAGAQRRNGG